MKLGDIIRGNEIGKVRNDWYIWVSCPDCKIERWVRRYKIASKTFTGLCKLCIGKRNSNRLGAIGEKHASWKGGRIRTRYGYIQVKLYPEDFFYPMAQHDGYVQEHRLVMAKHLGRCLLPWEVVHHKNGIRDDNRRENLELHSDMGHKGTTFMEQQFKYLRNRIKLLEAENKVLKSQIPI